jgi:hypothetical protein
MRRADIKLQLYVITDRILVLRSQEKISDTAAELGLQHDEQTSIYSKAEGKKQRANDHRRTGLKDGGGGIFRYPSTEVEWIQAFVLLSSH